MGISQRASRLKKLLNLRVGPGAAVLPKDISKLQLDFAFKIDGGHRAGRKVWREYLPRLKYHNPAVSMVVNRTTDQAAPSVLTLFYREGQNRTIDMKNRGESEILKELFEITNATVITATPEEEAEFKRIAEQDVLSEEDRRRTRIKKEKQLVEERMLAQARNAVAASATASS